MDGSTVTSLTSLSDEACNLATANDLAKAGVTGTITRGTPMQYAVRDNPEASVCNFDVDDTTIGTNLLITVLPRGGNVAYDALRPSASDVSHSPADLGDEARYSATKSSDPTDRGFTDLQLVVRKGDDVLAIGTPTGHFADEASLTALATVIIPKLG